VTRLTIASCDPGKDNFAFAISDSTETVFSVRETGFLPAAQTYPQLWGFGVAMLAFLKKHKPDRLVVEQYQFRGPQSVHAEIINLMIGVVYTLWVFDQSLARLWRGETSEQRTTRLALVMPSTWKTFMKRNYGQVMVPKAKRAKKGQPPPPPPEPLDPNKLTNLDYSYLFPNLRTPHEIDACCMGLWYHLRQLKRTIPES
jgi:hypothetical protein